MTAIYVVAGLALLGIGVLLVYGQRDVECAITKGCATKAPFFESCKETGIYNMGIDNADSSDESSDDEDEDDER